MGNTSLRIGDAERDDALDQLREHHAAGRIDAAEFDERMSDALQARTLGDLAVLFVDLPPLEGHRRFRRDEPGGELDVRRDSAPAVVTGQTWNWRQAASGAAFPLALIICFATGWRYWWIILIPMMVSAALLGDDADDKQNQAKNDEALGDGDKRSLPKGSA
ncbi:DUF1707 SHOCT-like domain-containing protein [Luteococcus sp. OSA5]|uniref:DUF1707 SHOCT-like domain-containing protein n=1 Tax=Luteococcus sp. OSA5 TaxID=3401630 RepID=UPI003B42E391